MTGTSTCGDDGRAAPSASGGQRDAGEIDDRAQHGLTLAEMALVLAAVRADDLVPQIAGRLLEHLAEQFRLLVVELQIETGADGQHVHVVIVRRPTPRFGDGFRAAVRRDRARVRTSASVGEGAAAQVEDRAEHGFALAQLALVLAAVGTDDLVPEIAKGAIEDLLQQLRLLLVEVELEAGTDRG